MFSCIEKIMAAYKVTPLIVSISAPEGSASSLIQNVNFQEPMDHPLAPSVYSFTALMKSAKRP